MCAGMAALICTREAIISFSLFFRRGTPDGSSKHIHVYLCRTLRHWNRYYTRGQPTLSAFMHFIYLSSCPRPILRRSWSPRLHTRRTGRSSHPSIILSGTRVPSSLLGPHMVLSRSTILGHGEFLLCFKVSLPFCRYFMSTLSLVSTCL